MNYLLGVALVGILAGTCLAVKPLPCKSPPEVEGSFMATTPSGEFLALGKYFYDANGQRVRLETTGRYKNDSFKSDLLFLYKEHVMYVINSENESCVKKELKATFHPMEIPENATLLGQVTLGSLLEPEESLVVNTWTGEIPKTQAKYSLTFTDSGCLPVSTYYYSPKTGWVATSIFNNIVGITDPGPLTPPSFCTSATMEMENSDFFSIFF
ncbi:ependymin-like [Hoplias malabaricus]|uniref:ependymin-like n=1 Tax=Hoplias malabaricus TaxID=27720 RepID=UPI003462D5A3